MLFCSVGMVVVVGWGVAWGEQLRTPFPPRAHVTFGLVPDGMCTLHHRSTAAPPHRPHPGTTPSHPAAAHSPPPSLPHAATGSQPLPAGRPARCRAAAPRGRRGLRQPRRLTHAHPGGVAAAAVGPGGHRLPRAVPSPHQPRGPGPGRQLKRRRRRWVHSDPARGGGNSCGGGGRGTRRGVWRRGRRAAGRGLAGRRRAGPAD